MKKHTEDNNDGKIGSRSYISAIINNKFKNRNDCNMFDFLGAGVGAEYYLKNCSCIKTLTLLDSSRQKYKDFMINKYFDLNVRYGKTVIDVINLDINDYLNYSCFYVYDIFNLDFCTYFYDNGKNNCTKSIIETVFENKCINDNGLLLCTFQIRGIGVNMNKNAAIVDPDTITSCICDIGKEYYLDITPDDTSYEYKSSVSSKMLNLVFHVKYK